MVRPWKCEIGGFLFIFAGADFLGVRLDGGSLDCDVSDVLDIDFVRINLQPFKKIRNGRFG